MILDVKLDFYGRLKNIIRPELQYGNIIYDQAYTDSIHQKTLALAITGSIRGISKEKIYQELGSLTL